MEPMTRDRIVFRDEDAQTLRRRAERIYRHISQIGRKSDHLN